jgi:hypothetical protein
VQLEDLLCDIQSDSCNLHAWILPQFFSMADCHRWLTMKPLNTGWVHPISKSAMLSILRGALPQTGQATDRSRPGHDADHADRLTRESVFSAKRGQRPLHNKGGQLSRSSVPESHSGRSPRGECRQTTSSWTRLPSAAPGLGHNLLIRFGSSRGPMAGWARWSSPTCRRRQGASTRRTLSRLACFN